MISITKQLIRPEELKQNLPLSASDTALRNKKLAEIQNILSKKDPRLLLVIGPCSADDEDAFYDYLKLLKSIEQDAKDKIMIVPRLYTAKPRSKGDDYKGIMFSRDPFGGEVDITEGLITARRMFVTALRDFGFACADELLHTDTYGYFDDVLGYAVIGARTCESQQHRFVASGIDVPVAFKNPTSGSLTALANALYTAARPSEFIYGSAQAKSSGNAYVHAMLRGGVDKDGNHFSNYSTQTLNKLSALLTKIALPNPAVLIDTNHSNSAKNGEKQADILLQSLKQIRSDETASKIFAGYMVESYISGGSCTKQTYQKGKSVTDDCLSWQKTEEMISRMVEILE